jgi:hypothetical protein
VAKLSDDEWIAKFKECGSSPAQMAKATGISVRNIYYRREALEGRLTIQLPSNANPYDYNPRLKLHNVTGSMIIFSDCHWWPGIAETVAYQALLEVAREIRPKWVVGNGDLVDGAEISRFGPIGWTKTPNVKAELDEVGARETAIRRAARNSTFLRTIGNHDLRYDSTLASRAYQFTGIKGFRLADHMPDWKETMSIWVNEHTVIKHRWHNGVNAGRNNTLKAGKTMVTGHDHILQCTPYSDYNGLRWAVQDGTLAEPDGPQFAYAEDNPSQANSGFVVLTFDKDGSLFDPEVCRVRDGVAYFRGQRVCGRRKVAA